MNRIVHSSLFKILTDTGMERQKKEEKKKEKEDAHVNCHGQRHVL